MPSPRGILAGTPELVVEVRSKNDRWKDLLQKVAEYLSADVLTVAVTDPATRRVHVFSADREVLVLSSQDKLVFPDVLPGFEVEVSQLFE